MWMMHTTPENYWVLEDEILMKFSKEAVLAQATSAKGNEPIGYYINGVNVATAIRANDALGQKFFKTLMGMAESKVRMK